MKYSVNLTYNQKKTYFDVEGSPSPYLLGIENRGMLGGKITNIDLTVG
jgi:hypothetical protein